MPDKKTETTKTETKKTEEPVQNAETAGGNQTPKSDRVNNAASGEESRAPGEQ